MSADSPKRTVRGVPVVVPAQVVSDRSIIDSVAGFINDVTLTNQPQIDPKDSILWARFETLSDISDPTCGDDWEAEGNVAPPLILILGYGLGVQVWAIPANGEAIEVLSWRRGNIIALRVLPTPILADDEMADEPCDLYAIKRPLMAICDSTSAGCSQQMFSANFISLKDGTQVKTIKFKSQVIDIMANRTSVIITFPEKIAVFDARSLEDRLSVTTCYPSPGITPNPIALGSRWLAYAEYKLLPSKRSSGGYDGDGISSYTATVLNAAKSLGKGLRELGEQVAAGLTGTSHGSSSSSGSYGKSNSFDNYAGELKQPGVITILDIKHEIKDISPTTGSPVTVTGCDPIIAHFIAHTDAIVAMEFDISGMLILTADKRGHDFHIFRIQPHPAGSHLAGVHHLYILHRGDTSAKVQDIVFSLDSRWVAVSTLRGTTHVFPITPYGGPAGVRTHTSNHVVNRLSRFQRSAGLSADGRSSSPVSHSDNTFNQLGSAYHNPRAPPFPRPTVVLALAQLRQPSVLGSPPGSASNSYSKSPHARQRLSSLSDDSSNPLRVCAVFAKPRSWLLDPPNVNREISSHRLQKKSVDSIFIMAGHGALIQYDLDVKVASNFPKDKIGDDTPIELDVEAKAQWVLERKDGAPDIQPPLSPDNWLIKERTSYLNKDNSNQSKEDNEDDGDRSNGWLSEVEMITHAGPHRRLWMGPQFVFKTYNASSGSSLSHIDAEAVEVTTIAPSNIPGRSSPMNMPLSISNRSSVPVLIESGSYSSFEQSPKLMDRFRHEHLDSDFTLAHGELRLKEDLADAMRESPSAQHKDTGLTPNIVSKSSFSSTTISSTATIYNNNQQQSLNNSTISSLVTKRSSPWSSSSSSLSGNGGGGGGAGINRSSNRLIEKIVNPLGTVTTITRSLSDLDLEKKQKHVQPVIHENCDESLFRPVVAIFCDDEKNLNKKPDPNEYENCKPPELIRTELVVPVITEEIEQYQKQNRSKLKNLASSSGGAIKKQKSNENFDDKNKIQDIEQLAKFNEYSQLNKKSKTNSGGGKKSIRNYDKEKTPPISEEIDKKISNKFENEEKKSIKSNFEEKPIELPPLEKLEDDSLTISNKIEITKVVSTKIEKQKNRKFEKDNSPLLTNVIIRDKEKSPSPPSSSISSTKSSELEKSSSQNSIKLEKEKSPSLSIKSIKLEKEKSPPSIKTMKIEKEKSPPQSVGKFEKEKSPSVVKFEKEKSPSVVKFEKENTPSIVSYENENFGVRKSSKNKNKTIDESKENIKTNKDDNLNKKTVQFEESEKLYSLESKQNDNNSQQNVEPIILQEDKYNPSVPIVESPQPLQVTKSQSKEMHTKKDAKPIKIKDNQKKKSNQVPILPEEENLISSTFKRNNSKVDQQTIKKVDNIGDDYILCTIPPPSPVLLTTNTTSISTKQKNQTKEKRSSSVNEEIPSIPIESLKKIPDIISDEILNSEQITTNEKPPNIWSSKKQKHQRQKLSAVDNNKTKTYETNPDYTNSYGIKFYQKFTSDEPEIEVEVLPDIQIDTTTNHQIVEQTEQQQHNIEFPSLSSTFDTKKLKQPTKSTSIDVTLPSPIIKKSNRRQKKKSIIIPSDDTIDGGGGVGSNELWVIPDETLKSTKSSGAKNKKKDFQKLSFTDEFLPPLEPLEPFESDFSKHIITEPDSLINFESPLKEEQTDETSSNQSTCSKNQYISAICGSLDEPAGVYEDFYYDDVYVYDKNIPHDESDTQTNDTEMEKSKIINYYMMENSEFKSLECFDEVDDRYLSMDQYDVEPIDSTLLTTATVTTGTSSSTTTTTTTTTDTSSSSEDTEEILHLEKKTQHHHHHHHPHQKNHKKKIINHHSSGGGGDDFDDELRPLIGGGNSSCSMTSSSGKFKDDEQQISIEIAKAIIDTTLPDNNDQFDSSDQGDLCETKKLPTTTKNFEELTTRFLAGCLDDSVNPSATTATGGYDENLTETVTTTVTGGGSSSTAGTSSIPTEDINNSSNDSGGSNHQHVNNSNSNGKKKSKKKRR